MPTSTAVRPEALLSFLSRSPHCPSPESINLSRPHPGPLHHRGSPWELSTHLSLSPWLCPWPLGQNQTLGECPLNRTYKKTPGRSGTVAGLKELTSQDDALASSILIDYPIQENPGLDRLKDLATHSSVSQPQHFGRFELGDSLLGGGEPVLCIVRCPSLQTVSRRCQVWGVGGGEPPWSEF